MECKSKLDEYVQGVLSINSLVWNYDEPRFESLYRRGKAILKSKGVLLLPSLRCAHRYYIINVKWWFIMILL